MSKYKYASARSRAEKASVGFDRTTVRVPDGVNFLSVKKAGIFRFDVLPYVVGEGNPFADEGVLHYERTFWTHRNVGPMTKSYVCLAKTFHKRCPVCELQTKLRSDGDKVGSKALNPSERQLMNVIDLAEPDRGVQLLDMSKHLFGKQIDDKILMADEDDNYENFFHLQGGMTLKVVFEEQSFEGGGRPFYKAVSVDMKARKDYDDSILKECHPLDDLLIELRYEDLKKILEGGTDEEEEEATPDRSAPAARGPVSGAPEDEDEEQSQPAPVRRGRVTEEDEEVAPSGGDRRPRFSSRK